MIFRPWITFFSWLMPFLFIQISHQQDCSATNKCAIGCCSSSGWCGQGPKFCGKDVCVSTCDRKSECNPGWGMEWSQNDKCPLDVCCSEFGFCGTTKDFCGNKTVERPSCSNSKGISKVIGYYESWSLTERPCNGLLPEEIPIGVYTHINFAFATIDPDTFEVKATSDNAQGLMERIGTLRLLQPDIKIWIAIGGWTFSDDNQPTAKTFSRLSASKLRQQTFAKSLLSMMSTYNFDGVDIDWYPVAKDRNGDTYDYLSFTAWMESLKGSLGDKGLSVTLPSSYWYLQGFDITHLEKHVDWFNVMLYDLHGSWDLDNKWTGPYVNAHTNMTEINNALDLLWRNKINADKVVFGMGFYGRSFTLTNPSCNEPGCTFASGGNAGECSGTVGVLLNPEIQDIISRNSLKPKFYEKEAVKTINWGSQWVSFDDAETWKLKGDALKSQCITNVMVWAVSHDDKNGTNAKALLKGLGKKVMDLTVVEPVKDTQTPKAIQTCRWTNCGEQCPTGFKNIPRDGTSQMMVDNTKCLGVGATPHQFCCPADYQLPTCTWRGHRNSGICKPGCAEGEVEVGTLDVGCNINHQSACCTDNAATNAYGRCKWVGSYPTCSKKGGHADCPSDYPNFLVAASNGAGGEMQCETGARSYCCKSPGAPEPFTDCQWYRRPTGEDPKDKDCQTSCPKDTIRLSMQKLGECNDGPGGWGAYCCKGQPPPKLEPRNPSTGNNQYKEFKALVEEFMKNPTCAVSTKHYDYFHNDLTKRQGLIPETCSAKPNFTRLVQWMAALVMNAAIALNSPSLIQLWNSIVAKPLDEKGGLDYLSLLKQYQVTNWDGVAMMNDILLDARVAGESIREYQAAETLVCELYGGSKKRDLDGFGDGYEELLDAYEQQSKDVSPRHISPFYFANPHPPTSRYFGTPFAGAILNGIEDGNLTLNYARWQYYGATNAQTGPGTADPFLELAYWIGPTPGVAPTATEERVGNLASFRNTPADRWVVFHIHIHENTPNLFMQEPSGNVFIGTSSIRMFHGQRSVPRGRLGHRRVYGDDRNYNTGGGNSRSGLITCPPGTIYYIGSGTTPQSHDPDPQPQQPLTPEFTNQLRRFGQRLWREHIVDSRGLSYVFQAQAYQAGTGPNVQFDITQGQPTLQSRDTYNYVDQYATNWVPDPTVLTGPNAGYRTGPNVPP